MINFLKEKQPTTYWLKSGHIRIEAVFMTLLTILLFIWLFLYIYTTFGEDILIKRKKWKMKQIRRMTAKKKNKFEDLEALINIPKERCEELVKMDSNSDKE